MGTGQRAVLLKETIERLVGLMSSQSISGVAAMRGDSSQQAPGRQLTASNQWPSPEAAVLGVGAVLQYRNYHQGPWEASYRGVANLIPTGIK